MFAAGFVVVAGVVHLTVGDPLRLYADMRSEKLMVMDEWQGRAYSAAFGSSQIEKVPRHLQRGLHAFVGRVGIALLAVQEHVDPEP